LAPFILIEPKIRIEIRVRASLQRCR